MTAGPFWFSALKFEVSTLNSEIMSEFGFTGVSQLQPGSETCAPSAVMSSELRRQAVVGERVVQRALAAGVAVGVDADGFAAVVGLVRRAVLMPKPGMILMNSAALLPTET